MGKKKNKSSIFISRKLDPKSPFQKLRKKGHKITDCSFLKFKELSFSTPPFHNAVFFYSGRAIAAYLTKHPYKANLMYGVMGPASNKIFKKITGKKADIVGDGNTANLISSINEKWEGYKVLFPKAKNSLDSLTKHKLNIEPIPLNVYDNKVNKKLKVPSCDILIFTSPMNFLGYMENHEVSGKKVFAMGKTTAAIINEVTGEVTEFPLNPSEKSLYELVLMYLKKRKEHK